MIKICWRPINKGKKPKREWGYALKCVLYVCSGKKIKIERKKCITLKEIRIKGKTMVGSHCEKK